MNVEIAERLAQRRREAGYSQEALAERLGVTRQAVSKWERSESSPDTDNLIALARLYGVSLDELLNVSPAIAEDVEFEAADRATGLDGRQADGAFDHDDESYVHITPWDGVHVKDSRTGDEVHVGWKGIHVKEAGGEKEVHVGPQGVQVKEGGEGWSGRWADWRDWQHDAWAKPIDDERSRRRGRVLYSFPVYLLATIAYLSVGFFAPAIVRNGGSFIGWQYGLFAFASVPLYYMVANAIVSRRPLRFVQGFWPFACLVAYLWMWLMEGLPHPTWVLFLSIPMVAWVCEVIRRSSRRYAPDAGRAQVDVTAVASQHVEGATDAAVDKGEGPAGPPPSPAAYAGEGEDNGDKG
jgi:HTH-type transcriptional regulator/antitoxin HipB